jgi:tryptophan synthase alpha chain
VSAVASHYLAEHLAALHNAGRKALVIYITAGHPDPTRSAALLRGLEAAGADVIELGVPFSDPLADGPVIQQSSQVALDHGMTFDGALGLVREAQLQIPVVLFSYLNPVINAGPSALHRASEAGVAGILITDLPVGADPARESWFGESPLAYVRLVASTTPNARMAHIAKHGSGFVYLISRLGVTGVQESLSASLPESIARLREVTSLPVCVGFGISTPTQARAVAALADGVVIGSAVVALADKSVDDALALVRSVRDALDSTFPDQRA